MAAHTLAGRAYLELQLAMAAEHARVGQGAVVAVWPNIQRAWAA